MDVHFTQPDLRRLDELKSEAMSVPFFEDERPLRGALGLVDWRLAGFLSQLIKGGRISGARGEKLLVPVRPRLSFEKLFLFGMGRREDFTVETFDEAVREVLGSLTRAHVRASVLVLPGRSLGLIDPVVAVERFLDMAGRFGEHDEVTLVDDAEAQKASLPLVERARRRARALIP